MLLILTQSKGQEKDRGQKRQGGFEGYDKPVAVAEASNSGSVMSFEAQL